MSAIRRPTPHFSLIVVSVRLTLPIAGHKTHYETNCIYSLYSPGYIVLYNSGDSRPDLQGGPN